MSNDPKDDNRPRFGTRTETRMMNRRHKKNLRRRRGQAEISSTEVLAAFLEKKARELNEE